MADSKVTALTELTSIASGDVAYIVDVSDTTDGANGTSKKITRANLISGLAASGANSDITSLTALSTPLSVAQGGTGAATHTSGNVLLGAGTSAVTSAKAAPSGDFVGTSDSQVLTNKTIDAASNTLTSVVTLTGSQTLTNKTLTAPKIADLGFIADANGNEMVVFDTVGSAVNNVIIGNASTGNGPTIASGGDGTDVNLSMSSKGAGIIDFYGNNFGTPLFTIDDGGDIDIKTAAGNIAVNGADPKRTMYVPASAMYPSTTAGCATLAQVESATNKVNIKVLDFDGAGTSKEFAEFGVQSPSYWDAGTVTVQFVWYASAGSGTVNWEIQGGAYSDDDALDAAYGTLQEVTDTLLATGDVHISAETSAVTIANTPVAGDWLQFRVARDPANDTNTSDARLMGVRIRFTCKQFNDL